MIEPIPLTAEILDKNLEKFGDKEYKISGLWDVPNNVNVFRVMAKVIRFCKLNEEHYGDNVFDVSRPNLFGNPYTHIRNRDTLAQVKVKTRDEAIGMYSAYFDRMVEENETFRSEWDRMYDAYKTCDTIYIGCYCKLDERCHGDIIRQKLIQRSMKEKVAKIRAEREAGSKIVGQQ